MRESSLFVMTVTGLYVNYPESLGNTGQHGAKAPRAQMNEVL
jgi:hypothetical protein